VIENRLVNLQSRKARDDLIQEFFFGWAHKYKQQSTLVCIILHPASLINDFQREQLFNHRLLPAHINKIGIGQIDFIRLAFEKLIHCHVANC
jgi:hypothetical protein